MKESQSFRLLQELGARLDTLATASRVKKGTLIEMCIEMHLPELEKRYAKEIAELAAREAESVKAVEKPAKRDPHVRFTAHKPQHAAMNDKKDDKKK